MCCVLIPYLLLLFVVFYFYFLLHFIFGVLIGLKAQAQGPNLACRTYEAQGQTQLNWPTSPQPHHPYAPGYFLLLVQSSRPRPVGLFLLPAHLVAPACRPYLPCISPCPKPSPSMHSRYLQVGHPLASSTGDQTIEPTGPCCLAQAPMHYKSGQPQHAETVHSLLLVAPSHDVDPVSQARPVWPAIPHTAPNVAFSSTFSAWPSWTEPRGSYDSRIRAVTPRTSPFDHRLAFLTSLEPPAPCTSCSRDPSMLPMQMLSSPP